MNQIFAQALKTATWVGLIGWSSVLVAWHVGQLPAPPPEAEESTEWLRERITIRTPTSTRVITASSMSLETLRQNYFEEGKRHTKVSIYHDVDPDDAFSKHLGQVHVEFTPESKLPADEASVWMMEGFRPFIVPGGSVLEVTIDGVPVSDPIDRQEPHWFNVYDYRFVKSERSVFLPFEDSPDPTAAQVEGEVVWSCEQKDDGGQLVCDYILKLTPDAISALVSRHERARNPLPDDPLNYRKFSFCGLLDSERSSAIRSKHGLSSPTRFKYWAAGDNRWVIGIDRQKDLVYLHWGWED